MCDKKNNVLFTDIGCFVLSPDFKLADESQILLKVPRKKNMYSVDMILFLKRLMNQCYGIGGRTPAISFMRPFRCHVTILNTLDNLGKFDEKSDEGFFVGYSLNSKAFRVYNIRTRKVEESLHIRFLKDKPIIAGDGPKWLFDIEVLTKSMNYVPVVAGTNSNDFVGTEESIGAGARDVEVRLTVEIFGVVPMCGDPLEDGVRCQRCTCKWCGYGLREGFCGFVLQEMEIHPLMLLI
ncbi:ribonuclease H-like domain-containing protein [Tanacetum coccineum]